MTPAPSMFSRTTLRNSILIKIIVIVGIRVY